VVKAFWNYRLKILIYIIEIQIKYDFNNEQVLNVICNFFTFIPFYHQHKFVVVQIGVVFKWTYASNDYTFFKAFDSNQDFWLN
jgi:hypothetical protein